MSLLLASSQTSAVTPPRPLAKKSSNCLHKVQSANSSCVANLQETHSTFFVGAQVDKKRTPIGDGLPGSWLQIIYLSYGDGRQNFKKATRVQSLGTCQACLLIGTHPHIVNRR